MENYTTVGLTHKQNRKTSVMQLQAPVCIHMTVANGRGCICPSGKTRSSRKQSVLLRVAEETALFAKLLSKPRGQPGDVMLVEYAGSIGENQLSGAFFQLCGSFIGCNRS